MISNLERMIFFRLWRICAAATGQVQALEVANKLGCSIDQVNRAITLLLGWGAPIRSHYEADGRRRNRLLEVTHQTWQPPFEELSAGDRLLVIDEMLADHGHRQGHTLQRLSDLTAERRLIEQDLGESADGCTTTVLIERLRHDLASAIKGQKAAVAKAHESDQKLAQVFRLATEGAAGEGMLPNGVTQGDVLVAVHEALEHAAAPADAANMLAVLMLHAGTRTTRVARRSIEVLQTHGVETRMRSVSDGWVIFVKAPGEVWCSGCEEWVMDTHNGECSTCCGETSLGPLASDVEAIGHEMRAPIRSGESEDVIAWLELVASGSPDLATEIERARLRARSGPPNVEARAQA
jgi:hypothetical protein